MNDYYDNPYDYYPTMPMQSVAKEHALVPGSVHKYVYRKGIGKPAIPSSTIICYVNCYLIDGTPVVIAKGSRVSKYLIGRDRLICGLQIGLKNCRKGQKFTLVIAPAFAYGSQENINLIPKNSKLFFQIEVIEIQVIPLSKQSDAQLYYQTYFYSNKAEKKFIKGQYEQGLNLLAKSYDYAKGIKHYKASIKGRILMKLGNILVQRGQYRKALDVLSHMQKFDQQTLPAIYLRMGLLYVLKEYESLLSLIEQVYKDYSYDTDAKRYCVQYLKLSGKDEVLKNLEGYDWRTDKWIQKEIKEMQNDRIMMW